MSRQAFTTCSPLAINCYLYQESGLINPWTAGIYYDGGTCWVVNSSGQITGTTNCAPLANIDISTNGSLDIEIYISSITVNGVGVDNITGVDPNTPGNGGGCTTTQIGTYDIILSYSATTAGQSIQLLGSDSTPYCNATSTGFNSMTFYGVTVNTSQSVIITASEGACA